MDKEEQFEYIDRKRWQHFSLKGVVGERILFCGLPAYNNLKDRRIQTLRQYKKSTVRAYYNDPLARVRTWKVLGNVLWTRRLQVLGVFMNKKTGLQAVLTCLSFIINTKHMKKESMKKPEQDTMELRISASDSQWRSSQLIQYIWNSKQSQSYSFRTSQISLKYRWLLRQH